MENEGTPGTPEEVPEVIKAEVPVEGFILFEETAAGLLAERLRTANIAVVTNTADNMCRNWPGVKFYVYSGITGKWYAYYKPIMEI